MKQCPNDNDKQLLFKKGDVCRFDDYNVKINEVFTHQIGVCTLVEEIRSYTGMSFWKVLTDEGTLEIKKSELLYKVSANDVK